MKFDSRRQAALATAAPVLILAVLLYGGRVGATQLLTLVVGLLLVGLLSRRPDRALLLMVVFVPFQQILLALLLHAGGPAALVQSLGSVKELVVAALVVAAVQHGTRRRWDVVDKLVLGYVALVSLYVVLPIVLPGLLVDLPFSARGLAWRANALFAVAFLAARRIPTPPNFRRTLAVAVTCVGLVAAACALVEFFKPALWSDFLTKTVQIRFYRALIFGEVNRPSDELNHILVGGRDVIRVGSVALSPIVLGFVMLVPLAFCLERVLGRRARWSHVVSALLCSVAIVLTLTRSAILAALLVAVVALRAGTIRLRPGRVQLGIGLVIAALVVTPLAVSSTVVERASSTFQGDASTAGHLESSLNALAGIARQPLGRGLGTAPGVGDRFEVANRVTSENAYLQVGAELGVVTMLVFILMLGAVIRQLYGRVRLRDEGAGFASAMLAAGVGLAFGGLFLQIWLNLATALTFWALAGVALGTSAGSGAVEIKRVLPHQGPRRRRAFEPTATHRAGQP